MGWTVGIPSMKLSNSTNKSKHCGNFYLVAAEALKERIGRDPDINPELSYKNQYLGFATAKQLLAYSDEHCSILRDAKGRALRSDAVRMCVTLFKPPAAYMNTLTEEEQSKLLNDGIEIITKIVGKENIRSIAIHFDEKGPHVHIFWEPMTEDGRLCAKEKHNLKFFGRLNKELPEFMRSRGWDIDDCDVYDEALYNLMSEEEKAKRRRTNGRNSVVYKADAENKLNEINHQIESKLSTLESDMSQALQETIDLVTNDKDNVYENVLFLMLACDDERFAELDEEGQKLKREALADFAQRQNITQSVLSLTEQINQAETQKIGWEERQRLWTSYREVSEEFWFIRAELKQNNDNQLQSAYDERYKAKRSYYDAMYLLRASHGWISLFISLIRVCSAISKEKAVEKQIQQLKEERQKLIADTASFKKYSNAYRNTLKAGQRPFDGYLQSMEQIVTLLDREFEVSRNKPTLEQQKQIKHIYPQ